MLKKMEFNKRNTVVDDLSKYDYMCNNDITVEVSEWINGEGITVTIGDSKIIDLSYGELDAINYLKDSLQYK